MIVGDIGAIPTMDANFVLILLYTALFIFGIGWQRCENPIYEKYKGVARMALIMRRLFFATIALSTITYFVMLYENLDWFNFIFYSCVASLIFVLIKSIIAGKQFYEYGSNLGKATKTIFFGLPIIYTTIFLIINFIVGSSS